MNRQVFEKARIIIPMIIGGGIAIGIIQNSFIIPLIVIIIGIFGMYFIKSHNKEIVQDERTYKIGSYAARAAIGVFSIGALIISLVLMTIRSTEIMWAVGQTLAFTINAILILYLLFYRYYSNKM